MVFGVAAALFAVSWGLLHVGFLAQNQIVDTPVYQRYGDRVFDGELPYRDFLLEYPPAALPAFIAPSLASSDDYRNTFEALMLVAGIGMVVLVGISLSAVRAPPTRLYVALLLVAVAPLLLGSVILTRFDLWPALLTVGALALFVSGRERLGFGALGVAVSAKLYPLVMLPLALLYVGRRHGRREALVSLAVFCVAAAVFFIPFLVLAPNGLIESFERQLGRPLQIESLGAAILLSVHQLDPDYIPEVVSSFGSQNLAGALADAVAVIQSALQVIAIVAVWAVFALGQPTRERFLTAAATAVVAFVAFAKVLSPQFMIWLIPLIPLVAGSTGTAAALLVAAALLLTQLWFPGRYFDLVDLGSESWLVLARNLVLVALYAVLLSRLARTTESASRSEFAPPRSA